MCANSDTRVTPFWKPAQFNCTAWQDPILSSLGQEPATLEGTGTRVDLNCAGRTVLQEMFQLYGFINLGLAALRSCNIAKLVADCLYKTVLLHKLYDSLRVRCMQIVCARTRPLRKRTKILKRKNLDAGEPDPTPSNWRPWMSGSGADQDARSLITETQEQKPDVWQGPDSKAKQNFTTNWGIFEQAYVAELWKTNSGSLAWALCSELHSPRQLLLNYHGCRILASWQLRSCADDAGHPINDVPQDTKASLFKERKQKSCELWMEGLTSSRFFICVAGQWSTRSHYCRAARCAEIQWWKWNVLRGAKSVNQPFLKRNFPRFRKFFQISPANSKQTAVLTCMSPRNAFFWLKQQ